MFFSFILVIKNDILQNFYKIILIDILKQKKKIEFILQKYQKNKFVKKIIVDK